LVEKTTTAPGLADTKKLKHMSLYTRKSRLKRLKKPKTVYKHVILNPFNEDHPEESVLVNYYDKTILEIDVLYKSKIGLRRVGDLDTWAAYAGCCSFVTSTLAIVDALDVLPFNAGLDETGYLPSFPMGILECEIPKGAKYVKGEYAGLPSYASNKLIPRKLIATVEDEEGEKVVTALLPEVVIPYTMEGMYTVVNV
jgi:hypothetical protein